MDVWVGTSGYSYPDWAGGFYPAGTKATQMLAYYSRQFPLVELNFTFYRPPTAEMLDKFAVRTPPGFQFLVKLPRTISHENRPDDIDGFRRAVLALQKQGRLSGSLWPCPFSPFLNTGSPPRQQKEVLFGDRLILLQIHNNGGNACCEAPNGVE
jgi:uncharacterized protein YecE (DUF72 family)